MVRIARINSSCRAGDSLFSMAPTCLSDLLSNGSKTFRPFRVRLKRLWRASEAEFFFSINPCFSKPRRMRLA